MSNLPKCVAANELSFGVIYILTDLYTPRELLDSYIDAMACAVDNGAALRRFHTQVRYVDFPPTLLARRFNAGNIGKVALLSCPVCGDINIDGKLVKEFVRCLFDFKDIECGDRHIDISHFLSAEQKRLMKQSLKTPDLALKLDNAQAQATKEETQNLNPKDDLNDDEGRLLADAERQREQYLNLVGNLVTNYVSLTHNDPQELLGETLDAGLPLIFAPRTLSPLVIDNDLRIFLTGYNDAEIRLHPLSKALYILFLRHPEGIELRNIDEFRNELEQIYDIIMPARDIDAGETIIDNVLKPTSGTLLQNLSRIKRFFKTVILDDSTAKNYYITGQRGKPYGISLPRNLVTLPRAFQT